MDQVTVRTSQNVPIQYEVAGIGARIGGYAIDFAILLAYSIGMALLIAAAGGADLVIGMLAFLPWMFYDLVCEVFFNGQSIGKRALNMKVVMIDGSQPSLGAYILRWLFRLIENVAVFAGVIPVVALLWTGRGQRLGDMAAHTTVVKLKPRVTLSDTVFAPVDEDYQPQYPQVMKLSDRDIEVIRDVMQQCRRNRDAVMLNALVRKVTAELELEFESLPGADARSQYEFLKTIIKDYNYLAAYR